jgi:hypothetical protein
LALAARAVQIIAFALLVRGLDNIISTAGHDAHRNIEAAISIAQ